MDMQILNYGSFLSAGDTNSNRSHSIKEKMVSRLKIWKSGG
jgi:hypothetical protein